MAQRVPRHGTRIGVEEDHARRHAVAPESAEQPRDAEVAELLGDERDVRPVGADRGERLPPVAGLGDEPQVPILPDDADEPVEEQRVAVADDDVDHLAADPRRPARMRVRTRTCLSGGAARSLTVKRASDSMTDQ